MEAPDDLQDWTDDGIIEGILGHKPKSNEYYHFNFNDLKKALSLKQKQQDKLLNKFNKKVNEQIKGWGYYTHDKKAIEIFEKAKQLAKEVFTKTHKEKKMTNEQT